MIKFSVIINGAALCSSLNNSPSEGIPSSKEYVFLNSTMHRHFYLSHASMYIHHFTDFNELISYISYFAKDNNLITIMVKNDTYTIGCFSFHFLSSLFKNHSNN